MSIVNTQPVVLTQDQKVAAMGKQSKTQMNTLWSQIMSVMNNSANFIYNCPILKEDKTKYTAQEVFNLAYGTDAADLCKLSDAAIAMIQLYTGTAPQIPPAGVTITKNSDGTVTVTGSPTA